MAALMKSESDKIAGLLFVYLSESGKRKIPNSIKNIEEVSKITGIDSKKLATFVMSYIIRKTQAKYKRGQKKMVAINKFYGLS